MPINFEASDIELDSPYFKRNKSIADEWAAYNLNNPSGLTGAVNGFYIHMKLTGVSNTGTFSVTGNHQLQNVSAPLPMKATYVDRTILVLESGLTQKEAWKIRLKTFQSSCSSLFQAVTPTTFNPNLLIISSKQYNAEVLQRRNDYAAMLAQHGLQKLTLKNGTLIIELNRLVSSANELAIFISTADTILQSD